MKTLLYSVISISLFAAFLSEASAQVWRRRATVSVADSIAALTIPPKFTGGIAYLEASSAWFMGTFTLNYEQVFDEQWSVRIGGGGGFAENIANGYGGLLTINYFNGGDHKFEAGAGISYAGLVEYQLDGEKSERQWKASPVISGGYRYQPAGGGMFFRAGVSYFSFGGGAHLSVGLRL